MTRPYYVRPWPLAGELRALLYAAVGYVFTVFAVLAMLTGCRPLPEEPPAPGLGEATFTCIDFNQHPREVPCPSGSPAGSNVTVPR